MILLRDFHNGDGTRFRALVEARTATDAKFRLISLDGEISLFVQCASDGEQFLGTGLEASAAAFAFVKGDLHAEFFCSHLFYSPVIGNCFYGPSPVKGTTFLYNITLFCVFYKSLKCKSKYYIVPDFTHCRMMNGNAPELSGSGKE